MKWSLKFEGFKADEKEKLHSEIEKLESQREKVRLSHQQSQRECHQKFHKVWGQLLKTGYQNSRFAHQVERFACLYTSQVTNLSLYSPNKYYRPSEDFMPHEFDILALLLLQVIGWEKEQTFAKTTGGYWTVYSGVNDGSLSGLSLVIKRWATKKTAGSTKNGRDSKPKNLGVKKFGGERVIPGNIIVRQRGTRFHPGNYVGMGKDHTLYALKEGCVKFERHKLSGRKWVHVEPKEGHVLHPVYAIATSPKLKTAS
ncbi:hypothetical protein F0562_027232 [Nyssa sinensis]|uniref:Ribosomal protein L27 n=1 Tax=Nyssa sinensis TaxID=561372 RepID=A0A5J5B521_9ASTE|nr:hypothetical protein F0562_027232 [Nyssa sinensis]